MGIVLPIFSRLLVENRIQSKIVLQKTLDVLTIVGIGMAFMFISLSPQIISLIGGAGFERSVIILQILGFYMASFFIISGINYFIVALGRQKKLVLPYLYVLGFNIVLGILGVYFFSYIGAAIASLVINLILMIFGMRILCQEKFKFAQKIFFKSIFSGIIMTIVFYFLNKLSFINDFVDYDLLIKFFVLVALIIAALIIYSLILYFLKAISKDDLIFFRGSRNVKSA